MVRPVRAGLERVERQAQVVDRARQRRQVVDEVERLVHVDLLAHVVVDEREGVVTQVLDVRERARLEVVQTENAMALCQERLAEVGAEEPGATGDEGRRHRARCYRPCRTRNPHAYELLTRSAARVAGRPAGYPRPSLFVKHEHVSTPERQQEPPPTLVCVHGLSASSRWWSRVVSRLEGSGRVVLLDVPRSLPPSDVAAWLAERIEGLGPPVDLAGHSLGALASARVASIRPELVRRLVLISPPGIRPRRSPLAYAWPLAGR